MADQSFIKYHNSSSSNPMMKRLTNPGVSPSVQAQSPEQQTGTPVDAPRVKPEGQADGLVMLDAMKRRMFK